MRPAGTDGGGDAAGVDDLERWKEPVGADEARLEAAGCGHGDRIREVKPPAPGHHAPRIAPITAKATVL